jgi:hypothetical protein
VDLSFVLTQDGRLLRRVARKTPVNFDAREQDLMHGHRIDIDQTIPCRRGIELKSEFLERSHGGGGDCHGHGVPGIRLEVGSTHVGAAPSPIGIHEEGLDVGQIRQGTGGHIDFEGYVRAWFHDCRRRCPNRARRQGQYGVDGDGHGDIAGVGVSCGAGDAINLAG